MGLDKRRKIDFFIKNLSISVRKTIFKKMDDLNPTSVARLLEKNEGYPSFKRLSYTDEEIIRYKDRMSSLFEDVNNFMMENKRYPLFSDSRDTYNSALEYKDLLLLRPIAELEEEFGCTFEEYVPREFIKDRLSNSSTIEYDI